MIKYTRREDTAVVSCLGHYTFPINIIDSVFYYDPEDVIEITLDLVDIDMEKLFEGKLRLNKLDWKELVVTNVNDRTEYRSIVAISPYTDSDLVLPGESLWKRWNITHNVNKPANYEILHKVPDIGDLFTTYYYNADFENRSGYLYSLTSSVRRIFTGKVTRVTVFMFKRDSTLLKNRPNGIGVNNLQDYSSDKKKIYDKETS